MRPNFPPHWKADELETAIAEAMTGNRHVHAARYPCQGCVQRAARAARKVLGGGS